MPALKPCASIWNLTIRFNRPGTKHTAEKANDQKSAAGYKGADQKENESACNLPFSPRL